jgi:hypothetical protein
VSKDEAVEADEGGQGAGAAEEEDVVAVRLPLASRDGDRLPLRLLP